MDTEPAAKAETIFAADFLTDTTPEAVTDFAKATALTVDMVPVAVGLTVLAASRRSAIEPDDAGEMILPTPFVIAAVPLAVADTALVKIVPPLLNNRSTD